MKKYSINIDQKRYYKKPSNIDFCGINSRVLANVEELTIEEIAYEVGEKGRAFTRARINGKRTEENFIHQDFLVLDFDGMIGYGEFWERCRKYGVMPTFTYKTFNYSKAEKKFRAVFVLEETITDIRFAKAMNSLLQKLFPEADKSCRDIPRLFLGGKGIIDLEKTAVTDIESIVGAAQDYMKDIQAGNYARNISRLGKELGIRVEYGALCIRRAGKEDWKNAENKIFMGKYVIEAISEEHSYEKRKIHENKGELKKLTGYSEDELARLCPLYEDFREGKDIGHDLKFLLVLSMVYIERGKDMFFPYLDKNLSKWRQTWKCAALKYEPCSCRKYGCPYADNCSCTSLYDKLKGKIRRINKENQLSLKAVESALECVLEQIVEEADRDIHVIKGQTALGKTEIYCNLIRDRYNKKFLIAVPTCDLQDEVVERLQEKGVECHKTQSLYHKVRSLEIRDLSEKFDRLYQKGFGKYARKFLRNYIKEYREDLEENQIKKLEKFLNEKSIFQKSRCIVTTHALFLISGEEIPDDYEVIIDEDILESIFAGSDSIALTDIQKLYKENKYGYNVKKRLKEILRMKDGETGKTELIHLSPAQAEQIWMEEEFYQGAVALFLESAVLVMDKSRGSILFFVEKKLPSRKMIILSATANQELYEDYFPERNIRFEILPKAEYKGKLKQYTAHSMSRECVKKYGEERVLDKIQKITGDCARITFKMLDSSADIYFGKTEGFNRYAGMNLAVIGTPHNISLVYKLFGEYFGYDNKEELCVRRIEHNGYSFCFMTYKNQKMRNLQIYLIESNLEQAIGRARLLRNDCTVYLFSNFPLPQAEILQEEYLGELKQ